MKNDDRSSMIFLGDSEVSDYRCPLPASDVPMKILVHIRDPFGARSDDVILSIGVISDPQSLIDQWINNPENHLHLYQQTQTIDSLITIVCEPLNQKSFGFDDVSSIYSHVSSSNSTTITNSTELNRFAKAREYLMTHLSTQPITTSHSIEQQTSALHLILDQPNQLTPQTIVKQNSTTTSFPSLIFSSKILAIDKLDHLVERIRSKNDRIHLDRWTTLLRSVLHSTSNLITVNQIGE